MNSNFIESTPVRLTQFSHGAGCGCKISPAVLSKILHGNESSADFKHLLVGNNSRDDAAVLDLENGTALISTTDFFMPVVDDPFDFGRIAATNAISDVYAMGGKPVLAIAILGWPIDKLPPEVAGRVIAGGKQACADAGIALAGGHSIDSPEPIFGLAVNGIVDIANLKKNNTAKAGDKLFLTKPLGIGIITTASKKGVLKEVDLKMAIQNMTTLNRCGELVGLLTTVNALTDVTGFGLAGHLAEMCEGSGCSATLFMKNIPVFDCIFNYIDQGCIPGGTNRNWKSFGEHVAQVSEINRLILADPQTSGGLLISVEPEGVNEFSSRMNAAGFSFTAIGEMTPRSEYLITVIG